MSLIRGKSERSAWLFDVFAAQRYDTFEPATVPPSPTVTTTRRALSILAGPGFRRFTRPAEEFSPYWDVRVRGFYSRFSNSSGGGDVRTEAGMRADVSFGLEYFTRWHFSIAAHSGLAQLGWIHSVTRQTGSASELRTVGDAEFATFDLAPALFVRGYF